jgi:hypothetical protein
MITVLVVAGVMAFTVAVALFYMTRAGARAEACADELRDEVARRGEEWIVPLRGATATSIPGGRGAGHGVLGLTDRRVVFQPITGVRVSTPLARLTGARLEARRREALADRRHRLTLTLDDGSEQGYLVDDPAPWAGGLGKAGVTVTGLDPD